MWIEAFVILGREERASAASESRSDTFNSKASILQCIPEEAKKGLPPQLSVCCLPMGIQRKSFHHRNLRKYYDQYNVILTDQNGNKTYGYCCTFFDICTARVEEEAGERSKEDEFAYMKCLCLISKEPLYKSFEALIQMIYVSCFAQRSVLACDSDLLAGIITRINALPRNQEIPLHVLIPIGRQINHLELEVCSDAMCADATMSKLLGIEAKVLLYLFEAVLLERKVIIRSTSKSKLSDTAEALCELLYPLLWQHIYIPIVPEGLAEYLEAPTPYLMGVLSGISTENLNYEQSIEIDIDSSKVKFGSEFSLPYSNKILSLGKRLREMARDPDRKGAINVAKHRARDLRALFLETVRNILDQAHEYFKESRHWEDEQQAQGTEDLEFLEAFVETQMFQNFFHEVPDSVDSEAFARKGEELSLISGATLVGGKVEIVSFQTIRPSLNAKRSLNGVKRDLMLSELKESKGYQPKRKASLSKLEKEALESERMVDIYEFGLDFNSEEKPYSNVTYSEKVEELFDCIYLFFQVKYGNLVFETTSSIVKQCIDSVGSPEYLTAMVDVFKLTIMESKEKIVVFHNLDAMKKLMSVLVDIMTRAMHSRDYVLVFGILSLSVFTEYKSTRKIESSVEKNTGAIGFYYILEEFPNSFSFWMELFDSILKDARALEPEEPDSSYEFVADLLLLGSVLFPDNFWYESPVQELANQFIQDKITRDDLKMMSTLGKMNLSARKNYLECELRGLYSNQHFQSNLWSQFSSEEVGKLTIPLLHRESEHSRNLPKSPVISMDTKNDLILVSTFNGRIRMYSNRNHQNGSRLGDQTVTIKKRTDRNLVNFSGDGLRFFVVSNKVQIWDTSSYKSVSKTEAEDEGYSCVCVNKNRANKDMLIVGNDKGYCKLWDHLSSTSVASLTFHGHTSQVTKVSCLKGEENLFLSSSRDGRVLLWDMRRNDSPLFDMAAHDSWVSDHQLFYSKNKPYVVSCGYDWKNMIWNLETGSLECILDGHTSPVQTISACSYVGSSKVSIASGDRDGTIHFWQFAPDETSNYEESLYSVRFCSDPVLQAHHQEGKPFVACYANNTVVSLDTNSQREAGTDPLHFRCKDYFSTRQSFTACTIDYSTNFVYSGCANGDVLSWNF